MLCDQQISNFKLISHRCISISSWNWRIKNEHAIFLTSLLLLLVLLTCTLLRSNVNRAYFICVFPICSYLIRPNWFNPFQIDWIRTPLYPHRRTFFSFFKNAYIFDFQHDLFKNCRKEGAGMGKTDCMTRFRLLFLKIHSKKLSWQDKNKFEWF